MTRYKGLLKILAGLSFVFYGVATYGPVLDYYDKLEGLSGMQEWQPTIAFVIPFIWGFLMLAWGAWDTLAGLKKKGNKDKKGKSKGRAK